MDTDESIMVSQWPEHKEEWDFVREEESISLLKEAIRGIRNIRAEMNVPPKKKAKVIVVASNDKVAEIFNEGKVFLGTLASASDVVVQMDKEGIEDDFVSIMVPDANVFIPFNELVDIEKEIARLKAEQKKLQGEVDRIVKKLPIRICQ